jgi:hypothetical protein
MIGLVEVEAAERIEGGIQVAVGQQSADLHAGRAIVGLVGAGNDRPAVGSSNNRMTWASKPVPVWNVVSREPSLLRRTMKLVESPSIHLEISTCQYVAIILQREGHHGAVEARGR